MNQKWALLSFEGRMRRRDYWIYSVPILILLVPTLFYSGGNTLLDVLSLAISLFTIYASTALNIKRLKDRNKSPWWIIITFLPLIGPVFALVELGILDGTPGTNRYGKDPKGRGDDDPSSEDDKPNKDKDNFIFEG